MFVICLMVCLLQTTQQQSPRGTKQPVPQAAPTPETHHQSFVDWLYAKLGIDPKVYARVVRGSSDVPSGRYVVLFDPDSGTEKVLADCADCWSPARMGDQGVAYLRRDGVWSIKLSDNPVPVLILKADDFRMILGFIPADNELAIVKASPNNESCPFSVELVKTAARVEENSTVRTDNCIGSLANVVRSGEVQGNKRLKATSDEKDILVTQDLAPKTGGPQYTFFDSRLLSTEDGMCRFDPIWLDRKKIVYIKSDPQ